MSAATLRYPHGTVGGYTNLDCRCVNCSAAMLDNAQQRRARGLSADDRRHGTTNGYNNYGCRCEPCMDAMRQAKAAYYASRKSNAALWSNR